MKTVTDMHANAILLQYEHSAGLIFRNSNLLRDVVMDTHVSACALLHSFVCVQCGCATLHTWLCFCTRSYPLPSPRCPLLLSTRHQILAAMAIRFRTRIVGVCMHCTMNFQCGSYAYTCQCKCNSQMFFFLRAMWWIGGHAV